LTFLKDPAIDRRFIALRKLLREKVALRGFLPVAEMTNRL